MTISLYRASIPVFKTLLGNLDSFLDKARAYAETRKLDPNALLTARLAPDMFHLIKQVQVATDQAKGASARLAGIEIPKYEDTEATFADLKARIAKTIAFLDTIKPEQVDGFEERKIVLTIRGEERPFNGLDYLLGFATPNVYFHVTAAYMILRHNGLELGKADFLAGGRR
jgi:uncharacterized protein